MPGDIWVLVEHVDGAIRKVSLELLSAASGFVTKTGGSVGAVLLGGDIESIVKSVLPYADRVYVAKDDRLATYTSDGYTSVLTNLVKAHAPSILLAGSTFMGKDLFPRLAMRLDTGLASDCTNLEITDEGRLVATRPIYGGKIFAQVSISGSSPQMATVRPNTFPVEKVAKGGQIIQTEAFCQETDIRQIVEGKEKTAQRKADITEAEVVIGVGRGITDPNNFGIVQELADVLGATIGVTRSVVDNGWWDVNDQIGKSGKNISARLYFAVALSGAVHHVLGIQTCGTVVAVNKDPNALIFNYADYGLVGDIMQVIPALKEEIAKVREEV
jgi:electron transfer flavoprotein alpha subunit